MFILIPIPFILFMFMLSIGIDIEDTSLELLSGGGDVPVPLWKTRREEDGESGRAGKVSKGTPTDRSNENNNWNES